MVFLVYLQAVWSKVREPSTHSQRSRASLPPEPVNYAVQHLRGFSQIPGVSPIIDFSDFTSYFINVLIVSSNRINRDWIVQSKTSLSSIFWTTLTD